jgi:hypothetical protein
MIRTHPKNDGEKLVLVYCYNGTAQLPSSVGVQNIGFTIFICTPTPAMD